MSEIYLRDDLFTQRHGPRKSTPDIWNILQEIRSEPPTDIRQLKLGFILKFQRDQDVNFIMQEDTDNLLQQNNITPDLSKNTRFYREILILDIPDSIYDEEEFQIKQDLEHQNNINIFHLIKYESRFSSRKFLKAIFYTRAAKENILYKGIIYLHRVRLHVSNSCEAPPDRSSTQPNIGSNPTNRNIRPTPSPHQHIPKSPLIIFPMELSLTHPSLPLATHLLALLPNLYLRKNHSHLSKTLPRSLVPHLLA